MMNIKLAIFDPGSLYHDVIQIWIMENSLKLLLKLFNKFKPLTRECVRTSEHRVNEVLQAACLFYYECLLFNLM